MLILTELCDSVPGFVLYRKAHDIPTMTVNTKQLSKPVKPLISPQKDDRSCIASSMLGTYNQSKFTDDKRD